MKYSSYIGDIIAYNYLVGMDLISLKFESSLCGMLICYRVVSAVIGTLGTIKHRSENASQYSSPRPGSNPQYSKFPSTSALPFLEYL